MKESGIEWIGQIPSSWMTNKIKYIVRIRDVKYRYSDIGHYIGLENVESGTGHYIETMTEYDDGLYSGCESGDLLYGKLRPNLAKVLIAPCRSCCTGEFEVVSESSVGIKYLQYLMLTRQFTQVVVQSMYGAKMPRANWEFIGNIGIAFPQESIRTRIVSFLDHKCAEIDQIAADIQAEIEMLEAIRASVISEAVTHGLDMTIPMKESGARWCRVIPAHWEMVPSKYLFHNSDLRKQEGDEQLTASQKYGIITQEDYMERENVSIVLANKGLEDWKHVEPFDFIISLRSFQGGLEMSEVTGCITWHYVVLKPSRAICHRFYKWLFKSAQYINALQGTCNFIRDGQDLRFSNFAQVPLFVPPMEEQETIADYLDSKCTEIDAAIAVKREQLTTLEEYKKSLIFEYVTGKKEVPV